MKIAIKNPSPIGDYLTRWGDYHFGASLQAALEEQGAEVVQHYWPDWDVDAGEDVILVLRGVREWQPSEALRQGKFCIVWLISHPADASEAELSAYDLVYTAGGIHQQLLAARLKSPVKLLRQCTDTRRFQAPSRSIQDEDEIRKDVIFVANSRGVRREIAHWAVQSEHPPRIIGRRWLKFGYRQYVEQKWIDNDQLPSLYRQSRLGLNDHWLDMRAYGFINNRVFDSLACGLPLLSDSFPELRELLGDGILYADSAEDYQHAMQVYESDYPALLERTRACWEGLAPEFSFTARAREILADVNQPPRPSVEKPKPALLALMDTTLREMSVSQSRQLSDAEDRLSAVKESRRKLRQELTTAENQLNPLRKQRDELEKRAERLSADLTLERQRQASLHADYADLKTRASEDRKASAADIKALRASVKEVEGQLDEADNARAVAQKELQALAEARGALEQELEAILNSRSWRLTRGFRWLSGLFSGPGRASRKGR